MRLQLAVLLLLVFSADAAELSLDGDLHYDSLNLTLQNKADYPLDYSLKVELKERVDGMWSLLDTINCSGRFSVPGRDSSAHFCNFIQPKKGGEYKLYARADIENSTYSYKDFFFCVGDNCPKEETEITLWIIDFPKEISPGNVFNISASILSEKSGQYEIYSYVFSKGKCLSLFGWKGNAQNLSLEMGKEMKLILSDSIRHDEIEGSARLRLRVLSLTDDKTFDATEDIIIVPAEPDLWKKLEKGKNLDSVGGYLSQISLILAIILLFGRVVAIRFL